MKIYFLSWAGLTMTYEGANTHVEMCWGRSALQPDAATNIMMVLAYSFFQLIKKSDSSGQKSSKNKGLLVRTDRKFVLIQWSFHRWLFWSGSLTATRLGLKQKLLLKPGRIPTFLWELVHVLEDLHYIDNCKCEQATSDIPKRWTYC